MRAVKQATTGSAGTARTNSEFFFLSERENFLPLDAGPVWFDDIDEHIDTNLGYDWQNYIQIKTQIKKIKRKNSLRSSGNLVQSTISNRVEEDVV